VKRVKESERVNDYLLGVAKTIERNLNHLFVVLQWAPHAEVLRPESGGSHRRIGWHEVVVGL
jgi:hypothetical protein